LSGPFLGLAIFTKIPAFTMIPLIGFLIYRKNNNNNNLEITMIADPSYSWIPKYVFHLDVDYKTYYDIIPANAKKVLLIVDRFFIDALSSSKESSKQIQKIYESKSINMIATFGNVDEYNRISIYQHESKPGIKTN
jgi:hypothetical protein